MLTARETLDRIARAFTDAGVTLDAAHAVIDYMTARTDGDAYAAWARWSHALPALARQGRHGGTVRTWAQAHNGQQVDTLQVNRRGNPWAPGPRKLDARRATFATLDGSRRDYAGTRVVVQSADAIAFLASDTLVVWTTTDTRKA